MWIMVRGNCRVAPPESARMAASMAAMQAG
jgi:hypothetical protein